MKYPIKYPSENLSDKLIFKSLLKYDICDVCKWWVLRDSNTRPLRYERRALTNWAKDPHLFVGRNYTQEHLIFFWFYFVFIIQRENTSK